MWYYPGALVLGKRDVIGAWFVCLIVAAACLSAPLLTAAFDSPTPPRHAAAACEPVG